MKKPFFRLSVLLLAFFCLTGCAARQTDMNSGLDEQAAGEENLAEEVAELPYPPADDGLPLTREEAIAFSYTSDFIVPLKNRKQQEEVLLYFKYFIHRGRRTMEASLARAQRYLPHVFKVFNEKGIPEDIAYLAIVESGFNPLAVSRAGAAGMWQFMPATGRHYGLSHDWWADERRDPYRATEAAAEYLLKLYGDFNDWYLALAAYNAGEGKIARALDGTGAQDFFELVEKNDRLSEKAQLREETQKYVPQLIAVVKIVRHLELLGFPPLDLTKAAAVAPLRVSGGTDLTGLARAANMNWKEFCQMNPAFRRQISPPGRHSVVYVPSHREAAARQYLSSPACRSYEGWGRYKIRKGDTLSRIAQRTGVPTRVLAEVNRIDPRRMRVGALILVPGSAALGNGLDAPVRPAARSGRQASHRIASGETLYSIAKKYRVSVDSLRQANALKPRAVLRVGQKLFIPGASGKTRQLARTDARSSAKAKLVMRKHTVQAGDTLWAIARRYNVAVSDLKRWNKLSGGNVLKPGDTLTIEVQ